MKLKDRIKNNKYFNKWIGDKSLFIERPEETYQKILNYLDTHKVERCFCVPPEKIDYEKLYRILYTEIKNRGIKIIPHIHLVEPNEFKIMATLWFFDSLGIDSKEIVFGWWKDSHPYRVIAKKLGLEIIEKHYHIYDFWL